MPEHNLYPKVLVLYNFHFENASVVDTYHNDNDLMVFLLQGHLMCQMQALATFACHEDVLGRGSISPPFLTLALDGGEWPASHHKSHLMYK
jgi:hypothetical protein